MSGIIGAIGAGSKSGVIGDLSVIGDLTVSGDLVPSTPLSHRNLVINGDMQVWQRADGYTGLSSGYYTVDRFAFYKSGSGQVRSAIEALGYADLNTTGFARAHKMTVTGTDSSLSAGDYLFIRHLIEGHNLQKLQYGTANAKTITLSFWCKSNITSSNAFAVRFDKSDSTRYACLKTFDLDSGGAWEKKVMTVTPTEGSTSLITASPGVINNDNGSGMYLNFTLMAGADNQGTADVWTTDTATWATSASTNFMSSTSNYLSITGIQLELGSNATPFEHRSYGEELALCQRYYENNNVALNAIWAHPISSANDGYRRATVPFKVKKRAVPTVTGVGGSPSGNQDIGVMTFTVYYDSIGESNYKQVQTWTADAEL